ncbi:MAG: mycofactocin system glycosyltransferase [Gaiellales bacterium]|nr:mycofactocin system glycosyltransferase [Gaiellales bacterium]
MIPLRYRLRSGARLQEHGGRVLLTAHQPQTVLLVNRAMVRLLRRCDGLTNVSAIAYAEHLEEESVFRTCENLRQRGLVTLEGLSSSASPPSVTVIVPVKDGEAVLRDCLTSILAQRYPARSLELMVVDDGSRDRTAHIAAEAGCRIISAGTNRGQSWARNRAAQEAAGDILAFIDADCVAAPDWLEQLVPAFSWARVGAVGGRVESYYHATALDRYESAFSSLQLGSNAIIQGPGPSTFYVPTCNMLVRRSAYRALGGLREDMRVGEDVDLCWRLRHSGSLLAYFPWGEVKHRHRANVRAMVRRRAQYGSSEALLHRVHPEKSKTLPLPLLPAVGAVGLLGALAAANPSPLVPAGVALALDAMMKSRRALRVGMPREPAAALAGAIRRHLSLAYFLSFHLVRYYLVLLLALGFWKRMAWGLAGAALLVSAAVDYTTKRPPLDPVRFLGLYILEHAGYQAGVMKGAWSARSLRLYMVRRSHAQ